MDGLLTFLCLLSLFITPGHSLSCTTCVGADTCSGSAVTCQSNYSCGLVYRVTTENGNTVANYIRSCVPTSKCNKVGSISYTGGTMKMGISCCDTDNCTPTLPQWPAESSQINGRVCSSCRSQSGSSCTPDTDIQCMGTEQTCLSETTSLTGVIDSAMGCATSSLCDLAEYSYVSDGYNNSMRFSCSPSARSSRANTSCVTCQSFDSLTCNGTSNAIPANCNCATAYAIVMDESKSYSSTRSYAPVSKCNIVGSFSMPGIQFVMGVSCCDGDDCSPSPKDISSLSALPNGVQCKTCQGLGSSCETNITMNCTGQETYCMNFAIITTSGNISSTVLYRGCGTKSLCDAQSLPSSVYQENLVNNFTCEMKPTISPSTTTRGNGGNSTTTRGNGGNSTTTRGNGGNSTTTPIRNNTTTPIRNSVTSPRNGRVIFPLILTAAAIAILHQLNMNP